MRGWWNKTISALESLAVKRVSELVELNDGVAELAPFETGIEVIITNAGRIIDFSWFLDGASSSHEGDRIDRFCLEEPQVMNCVRKFILSIIMNFGSSSNPCHVLRLNIQDDVSGGFGIMKSRWFSRKLSSCPVKQLFGSATGYGVINGNWYELELSSIHWTGSVGMDTMKVFYGILGIRNV